MNDGYLNKTQLKRRGWTDTLMKKHLPRPDKLVDNPVNSFYKKMALWDYKKILELEIDLNLTDTLEKRKRKRFIKKNGGKFIDNYFQLDEIDIDDDDIDDDDFDFNDDDVKNIIPDDLPF